MTLHAETGVCRFGHLQQFEAFAADRADDALHIGVLPRGSRCSDDLLDTHRLDTITEGLTI